MNKNTRRRFLPERRVTATMSIAHIALVVLTLGPSAFGAERTERLVVSSRTLHLLVDQLQSSSLQNRVRAIAALGQIGDPSVASHIKAALGSRDSQVTIAALNALARMLTAEEFRPLLEPLCRSASADIAIQAVSLLGQLPGKEAFESLVKLVGVEDPTLRRYVVWQLVERVEEPAPSFVVSLLTGSDPEIQLAASVMLARHPRLLSVSEKLKWMKHPSPRFRANVIQSLASEAMSADVKPLLVSALEDKSAFVRRAAVKAFYGTPAPVDRTRPLLADSDSTVRRETVLTIGQSPEADVITALLERLADDEQLVRSAVMTELIKRKDNIAAALLKNLANSSEVAVVCSARVLGQRREPSAVKPLLELTGHSSAVLREAAYLALGDIADPSTFSFLLDRAGKEKQLPRAAINRALGRIGNRAAVDHLIRDLHYPETRSKGIQPGLFSGMSQPPMYADEDTAVAAEAIRSLGMLEDPRAIPAIAEVAEDVLRNPAFWDAVPESLTRFKDKRTTQVLELYAAGGSLQQGMATILLPESARVLALHAIAEQRLVELTDRVTNLQDERRSVDLRKAAAAALSRMTGKKYGYRLPVYFPDFFVQDLTEELDRSEPNWSPCYLIEP